MAVSCVSWIQSSPFFTVSSCSSASPTLLCIYLGLKWCLRHFKIWRKGWGSLQIPCSTHHSARYWRVTQTSLALLSILRQVWLSPWSPVVPGLAVLAPGSSEAVFYIVLVLSHREANGILKYPLSLVTWKHYIPRSVTTEERRKWKGGGWETDLWGLKQSG